MRVESALTEFLSCYLSQDFDTIDPDPWGCVRIYARVEGPIDEVEAAAQEARQLVALQLPSDQLYERLFADHGMTTCQRRRGTRRMTG